MRRETTVTQKGQITIPAEIRARLGIKPRDKVLFEMHGNEVRLKPAPSKLRAAFGAVHGKRRPEDWRMLRDEMETAMAEEVVAEDR